MIKRAVSGPLLGILRFAARAALLSAATALAACASTFANLPSPIGLPADAPARPATSPDYPAVHDMPPARTDVVLTEEQRKKMEHDLATARDRQKAAAARTPPDDPASTQATGSTRNP